MNTEPLHTVIQIAVSISVTTFDDSETQIDPQV